MANDIIITPNSASIQFSGSGNSSIKLTVNASGSLNFSGNSGSLFGITDNLSGSLMSVNTIAGLPILEVFSDNSVNIGKYNNEAIKIPTGGSDVYLGSGSVAFVTSSGRVGIGTTNPVNKLDVAGNISASTITASLFSGSHSGSTYGTSSWSKNSLTSSYITSSNIIGTVTSASYALTSSYASNAGSSLTTGSTYPITSSWSLNSLTASYVTSSNVVGTVTSASYALTSSYAENGGGSSLTTGSTYPITSSWANNSLTASYFGSGTNNFVPKWNNNTLTSTSNIYDDGINVGIGKNNPLYALDILNAARIEADGTVLVLSNTSSNRFSELQMFAEDTNAYIDKNSSGYSNLAGPYSFNFYNEDGPIAFHTNTASNILYIKDNGNVGINTTSPQSKLHVVGEISASSISISYFTGSNGVFNTLTINGLLNATQISGSQVYVTSSQLVVTDNILTLNASTPHLRYAGLNLYDSGSTQNIASFLWDGENNYFLLSSSDAGYSRKIVTGPDSEKNLTSNYIPLITGSNGLINSIISQSLNTIGISGSLVANNITASLYGTSSWALVSLTSSALLASKLLSGSIVEYSQSYTLTNSDDGKIVSLSGSTASNVGISGSVLNSYFSVTIYQSGSGQLTFVTESGTVLRNRSGHIKTAGQYALASLVRINGREFVLSGDTTF